MGLTGACANQSPPPGGPEDRRPPVIVRTEPDTFGEMADLNGRVRFQFDERISENVADGDLASAVTVSPLTGEVRVSHGRSSLEVSLQGGFRPGLVYRVTLLPVVSDLFGNRMRDPFELVFSTGGEPTATATLAGEVWDRVTGQGLNGASVNAVGTDSLVHVARADDQGVFAFRYLPTGEFAVTAFQDGDRNGQLGPRESQGSAFASLSEGDTLVVYIPVLAPDTTPAQPLGASALDSITLVVQFDDYLDPEAPVDSIDVDIAREGDGAPTVARLMHEAEYARYVDQVADSFARLDSIDAAARGVVPPSPPAQADSTAVGDSVPAGPEPVSDSLGPVPDSLGTGADDAQAVDTVQARPLPPRLQGVAASRGARPGVTLPGQRLVVLLDEPLEPGEYRVTVSSVVNINGLPGGGGEVMFAYEPEPPPADSVAGGTPEATPADADATPAAPDDTPTDPGGPPAAPDDAQPDSAGVR